MAFNLFRRCGYCGRPWLLHRCWHEFQEPKPKVSRSSEKRSGSHRSRHSHDRSRFVTEEDDDGDLLTSDQPEGSIDDTVVATRDTVELDLSELREQKPSP
ncbi:MAG TPA: hypothetical protein DCQ98_16500 [Planctomycetaceae bacterium]|nr:hypothetical protein [Planctomycetaceae bacterium]HRF01896.1 hypothetical protein [Pirellulaceae bacterium]